MADPIVEWSGLLAAKHVMESGDDVASFQEIGHALFDGGNGDGLGLRQAVTLDREQTRDRAGRRRMSKARLRFLGTPAARRPFADDPQASGKSGMPQSPPELCCITQSGFPLRFKPWQVRFKRGLPDAEDIVSLPAQDVPDQRPAVARAANDLLDGRPLCRQSEDRPIGFFAAQVSLVLQPLRSSQQFGVDGGRANGPADLAHRLAHRIEEGMAGILHEMPAVSNLIGMRQAQADRLAIAAAAVTRDNLDLRLCRQPRSGRCRFAVRQQRNRPSPLQIAHDGAVAMIAAKGPVIDADHMRRGMSGASTPPDRAQQRVITRQKAEPLHKSLGWTTSESKSEVIDQAIESCSPARMRLQRVKAKPLGEDSARAMRCCTDKAADRQAQFDLLPQHGRSVTVLT